MGPGLERLGVRLARIGLALSADDVFRPGQRQEIAQLRRVDDDAGTKAQPPPVVQVHREDTLDAIRAHLRARRFGSRQDGEPARLDEGLRHRVEDVDGYARLEGETGDPAVAGFG